MFRRKSITLALVSLLLITACASPLLAVPVTTEMNTPLPAGQSTQITPTLTPAVAELVYVPNIGFIERSNSLRALAEPVSIERDGVRLTVDKVIANNFQILVHYKVEWLNPPAVGEPDISCEGEKPGLKLPDGSSLSAGAHGGFGPATLASNVFEYVGDFVPPQDGQNELVLVVPCLISSFPGHWPENWRVPFRLVPPPPGSILPVIDIAEKAAANKSAIGTTLVNDQHRIKMSLGGYVPMEDGYLLFGSLQWSEMDFPANALLSYDTLKATDLTGKEVAIELVTPYYQLDGPYRSTWTIKIKKKDFSAPLVLSMDIVYMDINPETFTFNVGKDPKAGQSWDLNREFQIAGDEIRILKAQLVAPESTVSTDGYGFKFDLQVDPKSVGSVGFRMPEPVNQCKADGGKNMLEHSSVFHVIVLTCRQTPPIGSVEVKITDAGLWGPWMVTWSPALP